MSNISQLLWHFKECAKMIGADISLRVKYYLLLLQTLHPHRLFLFVSSGALYVMMRKHQRPEADKIFLFSLSQQSLSIATTSSVLLRATHTLHATHATIIIWQSVPTSLDVLVITAMHQFVHIVTGPNFSTSLSSPSVVFAIGKSNVRKTARAVAPGTLYQFSGTPLLPIGHLLSKKSTTN